jgi:hypothetical protein
MGVGIKGVEPQGGNGLLPLVLGELPRVRPQRASD